MDASCHIIRGRPQAVVQRCIFPIDAVAPRGARSSPAWLDVAEDTVVPEGYEVLFRLEGSALLRAPRRMRD